jgi:long-subunit fatty acid transport protein
MNKLLLGSAALVVAGSTAYAGGIERTTQSTSVLFKEGNYVELGLAQIRPSLSGTGEGLAAASIASGTDYDDVGGQYNQTNLSAKIDLTDKLSFGLIMDSPFGADISYDGDSSTTELGGTSAFAETKAQTFLLKYKFSDRVSAFGGIRRQTASGEIDLNGMAYGGPNVQNNVTANDLYTAAGVPQGASALLDAGIAQAISALNDNQRGYQIEDTTYASGYSVDLDETPGTGFVLGAAYEIPDIALRVALTYNSEIEHKMKTSETLPLTQITGFDLGTQTATTSQTVITQNGETKVITPQSWNLEFQSGVAKDTLVFGSVRWVQHSAFKIAPDFFKDNIKKSGLVDLEDTTTYRIGVGRRFTPNFSAQASIAHERSSSDDLKSPLAPTNGYTGISIGGAYKFDGGLELAGGVTYLKLGDAKAATADTARADFSGNTAMGAGIRISYAF